MTDLLEESSPKQLKKKRFPRYGKIVGKKKNVDSNFLRNPVVEWTARLDRSNSMLCFGVLFGKSLKIGKELRDVFSVLLKSWDQMY